MDNEIIPSYFGGENPVFEESYHQNGEIYWYASDLMIKMFGYDQYTPTMKPIQKAIQVCASTNIDTTENFKEEYRVIKGKRVKDFKLSRFACYLVAMNSDIKKPVVAQAQAYFAAFTSAVQQYIQDQEDIERVPLRAEISEYEKALVSTAKRSGVENYAYFQNSGYRGLYNMPIRKIRELKGIPGKKSLFDYMGAEELGANIFRITQTEAKIKREGITGQARLENAAEQVGRMVRKSIETIGGTFPEDLPAREDIQHIKSDLKKTNRIFHKSDNQLKNDLSDTPNDPQESLFSEESEE
jgi:DNA-damage-inducible protein D